MFLPFIINSKPVNYYINGEMNIFTGKLVLYKPEETSFDNFCTYVPTKIKTFNFYQ